MIVIPLPSNHHPFRLELGIRSKSPMVLGIKIYDPSVADSYYIRRKIAVEQADDNGSYIPLVLPMPVSPAYSTLKIYNKKDSDDQSFELEDLKVLPIEQRNVVADQLTHSFIAFAIDFAQKAGYLPKGYYHDDEHHFLIHYMDRIIDNRGRVLATPARTNRVSGRIQVSKRMFKRFTVPMRVFILLHEYMHYAIPTRNETEADLSALSIYLDLGFSKLEALYAASKVFRLHPLTVGPMQYQRTADIYDFIKQYEKKQLT